eukprot:GHVS01066543.1.p1 GENE.GHVS01066543.1~~GHVS01066543.1.p1  ORF type:complete len:323 (-),score=23.19 GHVS01066543.1:4152-5120(-)
MSSANDADQADDASPSEDDALSSEDDALSRGRGDASSSVRSSDDSGRQPQEDGAPIRHGRSASHTGEGSRPEQHNGRPSAFINAGSALPNGGGTPIVTDFPRAELDPIVSETTSNGSYNLPDSHIRGWRHPGNDRGGDKGVCGKQPYLHQRTIATVSPTVPQCAEGNVLHSSKATTFLLSNVRWEHKEEATLHTVWKQHGEDQRGGAIQQIHSRSATKSAMHKVPQESVRAMPPNKSRPSHRTEVRMRDGLWSGMQHGRRQERSIRAELPCHNHVSSGSSMGSVGPGGAQGNELRLPGRLHHSPGKCSKATASNLTTLFTRK